MIPQLTRNALKGQQLLAQGSALGWKWEQTTALQGQKLLHLQRVIPCSPLTQGDALGYEGVGPSGRFDNILNSRFKKIV